MNKIVIFMIYLLDIGPRIAHRKRDSFQVLFLGAAVACAFCCTFAIPVDMVPASFGLGGKAGEAWTCLVSFVEATFLRTL